MLTDAVVRNMYYKYFHPKEALVSNGVLNRSDTNTEFYKTNLFSDDVFCLFREISRAAGKLVTGVTEDESIGNDAR